MNRPTLSRFRAQFPAEAMGLCQADPAVANYCNDATERLLIDPLCPEEGWAFGWATINLTATVQNHSAYVTVPQDIVRLIVMAVCNQPLRIRNGFWEFLKFGSGLQPKNCNGTTCGSQFHTSDR